MLHIAFIYQMHLSQVLIYELRLNNINKITSTNMKTTKAVNKTISKKLV